MSRVRSTLPPLQSVYPRRHGVRGTLNSAIAFKIWFVAKLEGWGGVGVRSPRRRLLPCRRRSRRDSLSNSLSNSAILPSGVPSIRKIPAISVRSNHPTGRSSRPAGRIVLLDRLIRFSAWSYRSVRPHYSTGRSGRTTRPAGRPAGRPVLRLIDSPRSSPKTRNENGRALSPECENVAVSATGPTREK